MRTRWIVTLAAVLLCAALVTVGCGSGDQPTSKTQTASKNQTRTVATEVGDHFSFGLDSNPSTGYQWTLAKPLDEKVIKMTATRFHGGSKPGQPGREAFWFEAVGEGTATIEMEYSRPWETASAPADTYTVSVNVTGKDVGEVKQYSDPNTPIDVSVGQEFVIALDSNPTTGYRWVLGGQLDDKLVLEQTSYSPEEGAQMGSGGTEYWRFDGEKAGTATITLNYLRPWEKDTAPAKTVKFTVNIK